jgi:hypothetical protein
MELDHKGDGSLFHLRVWSLLPELKKMVEDFAASVKDKK